MLITQYISALLLIVCLNQSVVPSEIIIVVSGPIGDGLDSKLLQFEKHSLIRLIRLSFNQGPGSRHAGIKTAKCDLIAIMDADDISPLKTI